MTTLIKGNGELDAKAVRRETDQRFRELARKVPELASVPLRQARDVDPTWVSIHKITVREAQTQQKRLIASVEEAKARVLRLALLDKMQKIGEVLTWCAAGEFEKCEQNIQQVEMMLNDLEFLMHAASLYKVEHADITRGRSMMEAQIRMYLSSSHDEIELMQ